MERQDTEKKVLSGFGLSLRPHPRIFASLAWLRAVPGQNESPVAGTTPVAFLLFRISLTSPSVDVSTVLGLSIAEPSHEA